MILLFFIITLATAIHYELSRVTTININLLAAITYLVGSIFFLFWSEPYIMPNGFFIIAIIQGISFLVNSVVTPTVAKEWNNIECGVTLGVLILIVLYAIRYFII